MTGQIAREPLRIPRRPRSELPTMPGWYLCAEAGNPRPVLLAWKRWSKRWEYEKSVATVPVDGWIGPVLAPVDELA